MAGKCVKHNIFYVEKCPCCGSGICFECGLQKDENGHNTRYTKRYYEKYHKVEEEKLEDTVKCMDCGNRIPADNVHDTMIIRLNKSTRIEWRCKICHTARKSELKNEQTILAKNCYDKIDACRNELIRIQCLGDECEIDTAALGLAIIDLGNATDHLEGDLK